MPAEIETAACMTMRCWSQRRYATTPEVGSNWSGRIVLMDAAVAPPPPPTPARSRVSSTICNRSTCGRIDRARAVNTRRETAQRQRVVKTAAVAHRTCFRPGCIAHVAPASLPAFNTGRISPSALGHSRGRRVELTRIVSDLFNDRAPPYQSQLKLDGDKN